MKKLVIILMSVFVGALQAQEVKTVAGTGTIGDTNGPAAEASFNNPHGIATDDQGTIYIAERYGHRIRKIDAAGVVTTLAGSGIPGNANGNGTAASFNEPWGICVGNDGNIYVADTKNNLIRKVTPQGEVSTFAGSGNYGITDGPAEVASFGGPTGIDMDTEGNLFIADHLTHIIRKITPDGTVSRLAGSPYCYGLIDGEVGKSLFNRPYGLAIDPSGNIIVADEWNHAIRSVDEKGTVKTLAGTGVEGHADAAGSFATFYYPWDVTVDGSGNIFVMDGYNHSIRKLVPTAGSPVTYGTVTFAGVSEESGWVDGYGTEAKFNGAAGIHYNSSSEEIFVADTYNNRIRKVIDHAEQSVLVELITNDQGVICERDQCQARAFPANFDTYIFFVDGQIVQSGSAETFATNNLSAGQHTISVHGVSAQGSFNSSEFQFNVLETPKPVIEAEGELPMPQESSILLKTDDGVSCTWSNGATTPTLVLDEPDVVTVDVLYENGCIGTSEPINIQQYCSAETPIIEFKDNAQDCDCFITSTILTTDYQGGDIQWLYYGVPIPGATENSYEVTETGVYQIIVTTFQQQVYSNILHVHISDPIVSDFRSDRTVVFSSNTKVKFRPDLNNYYGYYKYEWNFGDVNSGSDNFSNKSRPKHSFSGKGVYSITLKVTDLYTGCTQTIYKPDMIVFGEQFEEDEEGARSSSNHIIYIPNAFSPNSDGENDVLYVRGEEIEKVSFQVYNQKGSLVFESRDPSMGWDGTINGLPGANETYSYTVKATMNNGDEERRSGKVFLIR